MRKQLLIVILVLVSGVFSVHSQIPNFSFEFWTGTAPDEWITNNAPPDFPVSQTTDAYSGNYAVRGQVINLMGDPYSPSVAAVGTGNGFPVNQAYENLVGWYKADMISSDIGFAQVTIFDNSPTPAVIGSGISYLPSSATFQQFSVPISYFSASTPASAVVSFTIVDTGSTLGFVGSYFIIDEISLTSSAGLSSITPSLFEVTTNPVVGDLRIKSKLNNEKSLSLQLVNTSGKIVLRKTINSGRTNPIYVDVRNVPDGIYLLNIYGGEINFNKSILIQSR